MAVNENLIVGGLFTTAGGTPALGIAQWDGSTWDPLGEGAGYTFALTSYEGNVIAGGGGLANVGFVKSWNGHRWQQLGEVSGCHYVDCIPIVYALAVFDDGTGSALYAAGDFFSVDGTVVNSIARWDGVGWESLDGGMNGPVLALLVYDGVLIAGGSFTTAGGNPVAAIAAWNGSTWSPLGEGMWWTYLSSLVEYNGDLIASGGGIHRWNRATGWQELVQGGEVYSVTMFRGEMIAGGPNSFETAPFFARWTDTNIPWIATNGQPQDANVTCTGAASYTVTPASGYENLSYQWHRNGVELLDGPTPHGSVVSGATTSTLIITTVGIADAGDYHVVVSNTCGETASDAAQLSFTQCGDVTGDGFVNVHDLLMVINNWGACPAPPAACAADVAPSPGGDGTVGVPDLLMVINNWR